jgi:mRNA-degrading endonuclease RelE of RelBE toxin-antitoxin system
MPTKINTPKQFIKKLSRLIRKYPLLLPEFDVLRQQIANDERPGDLIPNVGYEVYKVRLKNPDSKKGKSGGFRVVYYVRFIDRVTMLSIYSKTEETDISPQTIIKILEDVLENDADGDET